MNIRSASTRRLACALLLWLAGVGGASAQAFPSKPLRIVVPYTPGGYTDQVARIVAKGLSERLGQPVIVDNKPGAGTVIGTDAVAKSPPDGHTLLVLTPAFAINAGMGRPMPFDTVRDFAPVANLVAVPLVLAVNPALPVKTVAELVAHGKRQPLSYGTAGNGSTAHLVSEVFRAQTGLDLVNVPYKGSAPAMSDLMSGQTALMFDTLFLLQPQVQAGKLRALAQTGRRRSPLLPDVPTMIESGFANFEATSWLALAVPSGTPKDVIQKLNAVVNQVLDSPELRESVLKQGAEIRIGTVDDAARALAHEMDWLGKSARAAGIKPD